MYNKIRRLYKKLGAPNLLLPQKYSPEQEELARQQVGRWPYETKVLVNDILQPQGVEPMIEPDVPPQRPPELQLHRRPGDLFFQVMWITPGDNPPYADWDQISPQDAARVVQYTIDEPIAEAEIYISNTDNWADSHGTPHVGLVFEKGVYTGYGLGPGPTYQNDGTPFEVDEAAWTDDLIYDMEPLKNKPGLDWAQIFTEMFHKYGPQEDTTIEGAVNVVDEPHEDKINLDDYNEYPAGEQTDKQQLAPAYHHRIEGQADDIDEDERQQILYDQLQREKGFQEYKKRQEAWDKPESGIWPDADILEMRGIPKPRVMTISAGGVWYHGSSRGWGGLQDRAISLTSDYAHADAYQDANTVAFRVKAPIPNIISIPHPNDRVAMDAARFWLSKYFGVSFMDADWTSDEKMTEALCSAGYNGIYFREIVSGGDELRLCSPAQWLEEIGPTMGPIQAASKNSGMIAIYPSAYAADEIKKHFRNLPNSEGKRDLHVTLVYLGKNLTEEQWDIAKKVCDHVADAHESMWCRTQGVGVFDHDDDGRPFYCSIDAIGMNDLRADLVAALEARGISVPRDYDFTPHMTVAYLADLDRVNFDKGSPNIRWECTEIDLVRGDKVIHTSMLGGMSKAAGGFGLSLQEITSPGIGNGGIDNPANSHENPNTSEDPDLKLGEVEAPYSMGDGPMGTRFDDDKKYDMVKGASVGNIVRLLGLPRDIAERIRQVFPSNDFAAAKAMVAYFEYLHNVKAKDHPDAFKEMLPGFLSPNSGLNDDPRWNAVWNAFNSSGKFRESINKFNWTWDEMVENSMAYAPPSKLTVNDAILKFPDGFYWVQLSGMDDPSNQETTTEGLLMQHCGVGTEMYSLRDPQNKPHVTVDIGTGALDQVKGKQNAAPDQKYWPYIKQFVDKFNIKDFNDPDTASDAFMSYLGMEPSTEVQEWRQEQDESVADNLQQIWEANPPLQSPELHDSGTGEFYTPPIEEPLIEEHNQARQAAPKRLVETPGGIDEFNSWSPEMTVVRDMYLEKGHEPMVHSDSDIRRDIYNKNIKINTPTPRIVRMGTVNGMPWAAMEMTASTQYVGDFEFVVAHGQNWLRIHRSTLFSGHITLEEIQAVYPHIKEYTPLTERDVGLIEYAASMRYTPYDSITIPPELEDKIAIRSTAIYFDGLKGQRQAAPKPLVETPGGVEEYNSWSPEMTVVRDMYLQQGHEPMVQDPADVQEEIRQKHNDVKWNPGWDYEPQPGHIKFRPYVIKKTTVFGQDWYIREDADLTEYIGPEFCFEVDRNANEWKLSSMPGWRDGRNIGFDDLKGYQEDASVHDTAVIEHVMRSFMVADEQGGDEMVGREPAQLPRFDELDPTAEKEAIGLPDPEPNENAVGSDYSRADQAIPRPHDTEQLI